MRVVLISDTHGLQDRVDIPDGDVLLHAGDLTFFGGITDLSDVGRWFEQLPHKHKLLVPGNHDFYCEPQRLSQAQAILSDVTILIDQAVEIDGVHFYGSPYQPSFHNLAFNLPRGAALVAKWALIPPETDVLITHTPPHGILDWTTRREHVGCRALRQAVKRIRPKIHLFGHIHEAYGQLEQNGTTFVNASVCTRYLEPINKTVVIDL
ncbi:MAG: metallophosphatase domain-containing protein [Candidatus Promineifilaceae bacterium]